MAGSLPAVPPQGQTGAPEPLACETLPLYALELDGVFAGLRGYRGPPEVGAPSSSPSLLALESQVRANPFDKHTWDSILAVSPNLRVSSFSTGAAAAATTAAAAAAASASAAAATSKASQLWLSYVKFIYCTGSVNDFRVALTSAVEKATGPLIPTDVEQRAFRAPGLFQIPPVLGLHIRGFVVAALSTASCLGTAIGGMDGVWTAYCAFERSVGSTAHLAAKVVAAFEERFADARKTHAELTRLTRDIDWTLVALPLTVSDKSRHTCLLSCAYRADIWFDYFQFLLAHQMPTKELLQLVLAEFFEDRKLPKAADAVYRNALSGALLEGPAEGGPLADADYKASPVLLLRYLDFIRRAYGIVAWRACFEEMAQLHRCGWEVFVAHAETEWKLCRSEQHALAALRKGAAKFKTQTQFIAAYADLLLDMGRLEGARELLRQSVLTLQSELGTGSRLLWKKWIRLESRFGDQTSLRSVIELRAMQRLSLGLDEAVCSIGREGKDSAFQGEGADSSPAALLEQEVLCNLPHRSKASDVGPKDLAQAKFNIRRRQFMGGDSLQDLCEVYTVRGMAPRTFIPEAFALSQKGEADLVCGVEGGSVKQGLSSVKEREEDDFEEEAPPAGATAKASAQWAMIVRPDLDSMAAFHPEFSTLYQPDSLQQQQQPAAAAAAAGDNSFIGTVAARDLPMFAPPKILCDIVALLPKPNGKLAADPAMVDYLLATLQATQLPPLPPVQHKPLVVKDLLALRHSQLHCLQASRPRGGEEGLGEEGDLPGGQSDQDAEDMSDVSAEEVQRPSVLQPAAQLAGQLAADFSRPAMGGGMQVAPAMYGAPHLMVPADSMIQARRMLAPAVIPGVRPIWTGMNMLPGHYAHLAAAPQLHPAMPLPYGISVAARPMQGVSLTRQPMPMWRVQDAANRSFQQKKKTR
ncbi:hypothetical protein Emag_003182 [Eimeria magna]